LADDFKGKPPHSLLGVNSYWSELSASTTLMSYEDGSQTFLKEMKKTKSP
jgi:hypothetical protein